MAVQQPGTPFFTFIHTCTTHLHTHADQNTSLHTYTQTHACTHYSNILYKTAPRWDDHGADWGQEQQQSDWENNSMYWVTCVCLCLMLNKSCILCVCVCVLMCVCFVHLCVLYACVCFECSNVKRRCVRVCVRVRVRVLR